jgi:lysozyme
MTIVDLIARYEGFREEAYYCSEGYPTIAYGKKIGPKGAPLENYIFTVPQIVATRWLKVDIEQIAPQVNDLCPGLDGVRHGALVSMVYQMGLNGVKNFRNMIAALKDGDWQRAHDEALDSRWAEQTPKRALQTANMLLTGQWPA